MAWLDAQQQNVLVEFRRWLHHRRVLIPLRCDAPAYHKPWATITVMVLCVALQIWIGSSEAILSWILIYGEWNPLQWISSTVVHADWMHLIGNMVFLWVFGLIVEGKTGWWRFALIILGVAVVTGAIEQTIMLGADGGSLGFSGVIFGLIAVAWLWAPENEVDVLLLFPPFIKHFEIKVRNLGMVYIGLELIYAAFNGFQMSTPILHLLGALAGFPVGFVLLKKGWVDCEGWDWFSRSQRGRINVKPPGAVVKVTTAPEYPPLENLLVEGDTDRAYKAWQARKEVATLALTFRLAAALVDKQMWTEADRVVEAVLNAEPAHTKAQLMKAWILIQDGRPSKALDFLADIQVQDPADVKTRDHIREVGEARKAENPYELA